jgi:hypothetical protein
MFLNRNHDQTILQIHTGILRLGGRGLVLITMIFRDAVSGAFMLNTSLQYFFNYVQRILNTIFFSYFLS